MADAVFTEVLEIQIDTAGFAESLAQLESVYEDFVDRVNAKGLGAGNIINVATFQQIQDQINNLAGYVESFDATVTQSMDSLASEFSKVQAEVEATGQAVVDAQASAAQATANSKSSGATAGGASSYQGISAVVQQMTSALGLANGGIVQMVANVALVRGVWMAVTSAIEMMVAVIKAPFEFLADGVKYLSDLQDKAADLQGVIAGNVKFSSDLAMNFQLAGKAAAQVIPQLQNLAATMGVPVENLDRTFKSLLESGVMNFTHGLQGAVDITKELTLAMMASGASLEGQRKLLTEIPELLSGQITAHSRILEVLHMSVAQWQVVREEALKTGDLSEVLAEKLQPYLSVLEGAQLRQSVLNTEIGLQRDRIAGAIALPLYAQWVEVLQKVLALLKGHESSLTSQGGAVVSLIKSSGQLLLEILKLLNPFTSLAALGKALNDTLAVGVFAARTIVDFLVAGVQQLGTLLDTVLDPKRWFKKDAWSQTLSDIQKEGMDAVNKIYDAAADANDAMHGKKNVPLNDTSLLNQGTASTPPPGDNGKAALEAFKEMEGQYREELDKSKEAFKVTESAIKASVEARTTSVHDGTVQTVKAINDELLSIDGLIKKYQELAQNANVPTKNKQPFLNTLNTEGVNASTQAVTGINDALGSDQKDSNRIEQEHDQAELAMARAHAQALLAVYQEQVTQGRSLKTNAFDKEVALEEQEHQSILKVLNDELADANENAEKIGAAKDKIAAEDQRFTDQQAANVYKRIALAQEEVQKQTQGADALGKSVEDRAKVELVADEASNTTSARKLELKRQIAAEELLLAENEQKAAAYALLEAEANGADAEKLEALTAAKNAAGTKVVQAQIGVKAESVGDESDDLSKIFGQGVTDLKSAFTVWNNGVGVYQDATGQWVNAVGQLTQQVPNFQVSAKSFADGVSFFTNATKNFISAVSQGLKEGGVAGGIGAGASDVGGLATSLDKSFGPALNAALGAGGPILQAAGAVFSLIGGLFTAKAKEIADEIKKSVTDIQNSFSEGTINITEAISELEQQRQEAITRLSGQKGGQDQLNTLLPQLDSEISSLEQQQQQTLVTFQEQLNVLQTQGGALGQFLTTWQQINDQVTAYLAAGGDANVAAQALNSTLQQIVASTTASLQQADAQAVSDALNLNNLLLQRAQLSEQYLDSEQAANLQFEQQQFSLQNGQAIERNAFTSATSQAIQLAENAALQQQAQQVAQQNYQTQLEALNSQISLAQQQVSLESQVFSIATDTATLQAQSNALTISQLQTQLQQWQQMQQIIEGITTDGAGNYSQTLTTPTPVDTSTYGAQPINVQTLTPNLNTIQGASGVNPGNPSGVTIGTLQVNVNGDPTDPNFPQKIVSDIYTELRTQGRYGIDTSYSS